MAVDYINMKNKMSADRNQFVKKGKHTHTQTIALYIYFCK